MTRGRGINAAADLMRRGYWRLNDLRRAEPVDDKCRCLSPDVWVKPTMDGNVYRCGKCGRYVHGVDA